MNAIQALRFRLTGVLPADYLAGEDKEVSAALEKAAPTLDLPVELPFWQGDKSITIGDVIPLSARGRPVITNWTEAKAIRDGLKVSVWVFACIYRIAKSLASVPIYVERRVRGSEEEWEPVKGRHPLGELINNPNPFWSRQDLFERAVFHLMLSGNTLFTKIRARGVPRELWLISPDLLKPIASPTEVVEDYLFKPPQGNEERIAAGDVIHVQLTDPANPLWGMSPLLVLARTVDMDVASEDHQLSSLQNQAVPSGLLVFNKSLNGPQKTELEERVAERRSGPRNARRTMVLSGREASYHQLGLSPVEMDLLESRKATRQQICSVFGVPQVLVGIFEDMALANANVSRLIYWEETVIPLMVDFIEALNRSLSPEFGDDVRLAPDFSRVPALRELLVTLADTAKKYHDMGVPFDHVNKRLGLGFDPFPGSDTSWVPSGKVPAELALFDAVEPDPSLSLPAGEGGDDGDDGEGTPDPLEEVDDDAGEVTDNPLEEASSTIIDLLERKRA